MLDFLYDNWYWVATIIGLPVGFYIPGVRALLKQVLKAALSKAVLEQLALEVLEYLASKTKSKVDDKIVNALKKQLGK